MSNPYGINFRDQNSKYAGDLATGRARDEKMAIILENKEQL